MTTDHEEQQKPAIMLEGKQVALGPLRRDLQPLIVLWFNDLEVLELFSSTLTPLTLESAYDIYDRLTKSQQDVVFSVYERESGIYRPIGYAGLYNVSQAHRSAELTIVIGDKRCWGQGYGTETACLLLEYGFGVLNLHNVIARVYAYNQRSLGLAKRVGFREIGRRREGHWRGGQPHDVVFLDILDAEWRALKPE